MNASNPTTDENGSIVMEGNFVRVVSLSPNVIQQLSAQGQKDVRSMIGKERP
ncbi:MAG: hypothetical protein WCZ87_12515 [Thiohalobacteraceae bacterium]